MEPLIKTADICKEYRMGNQKTAVLHNINLAVARGEWVSIMGPSGSGKSTLVNILGCLDVPSGGSYWLEGEAVAKLSEDKLASIRNMKIGFIFQSFNLLSKISALENVELPLIYRNLPSKERREKSKEALEAVGLTDRMQHLPTQLSGGQQQRVAIARALAGDPPLIIADEPTGNLDSKSGVEVMKIIKDLHDQGRTILLITHDPQVAKEGQRLVHILDGRLYAKEELQ